MPLYFDTPGLRLDEGYHWDQKEDFPHKPGSTSTGPVILPTNRNSRLPPMNDRQRNQVHRLIRVQSFCELHAPKFTNTPAKPGDAKFHAAVEALQGLNPQIGGKQSKQASGSFGQASANQAQERLELLELLRAVNRMAAAWAAETNNLGLMDRFRMPATSNDVVLAAAGDAFADAIEELNLAATFTELGYEGDVAVDLRAEAQDIREAEGDQGDALSSQTGATAALPGLLRTGSVLVKTLDAIIKYRFRNNAELLGAWKTASHVTATPGGDEPPPPPDPPTQP